MYKVKLERFEGPLDLLLQLIECEDLDITQVSLAKVADQYIEYVNSKENIPLEELSDFLLIASKLLYIKSKSLLPYLSWDEEDEEAENLEEQLRVYKKFIEASRILETIAKSKNCLFSRERAHVPQGFYPPKKISPNILAGAFKELLGKIEPLIKKGRQLQDKVVSIKEKIENLKKTISKKAKIGFQEFAKNAKDKTEVIVSFLALLELMKQKMVNVSQKSLFEDIVINKK